MICVDTSVWIEFLRGRDRPLVEKLSLLLDDDMVILSRVAMLELMGGASKKDALLLKTHLSALPILDPQPTTWDTVEKWIGHSKEKGERFGIVDLLIAAQASEQGASVWSLDNDFQRMAKLRFITAFED